MTMIFYKIIFILIFIIEIAFSALLCPIGEYSNGIFCSPCSFYCRHCTGPLPKDCIKCFPRMCKSETNECVNCANILRTSTYSIPEEPKNSSFTIPDDFRFLIFASVITFSMLSMISILCWCIFLSCIKRKQIENAEKLLENESNDKRIYYKNFPSSLQEGNLLFTEKEPISSGSFGRIYKCPYVENGKYIYVAIKIAKLGNREALKEREILAHLCHPNIIELLSINIKVTMILIMPLRRDNLKSFLSNEKNRIRQEHQIRYCVQIADGLRYLVFKKLVHNDLKASNILVVNIKHVEISDFGKCEYIESKKRTVGTITHTAMELYEITNKFAFSSEKTDVWSFGVTVWEIFTFGDKIPYQDELKRLTEIHILDLLVKGQRLTVPCGMLPRLSTIMLRCWMQDPNARPNFNEIFDQFSTSLPESASISRIHTRASIYDSS